MPEFWDANSPNPIRRKENTLDRLKPTGKFIITLVFYQKKRLRTRSFGPFSSYPAAARVRDLMKKQIARDNEWSDSQKTVHVSALWTDPKHEV